MDTNVYLEDEFARLTQRVATVLGKPVYYMFGHPKEVTQRLQELTKSKQYASKKFPLVWLMTDFTTDRGLEASEFDTVRISIIIANITEQNYRATERLEKNFKPILMPIWDQLKNEIALNKNFGVTDELRYNETRRYFWGSIQTDANQVNDFIDAIEISDLTFSVKKKICAPNKLTHSF